MMLEFNDQQLKDTVIPMVSDLVKNVLKENESVTYYMIQNGREEFADNMTLILYKAREGLIDLLDTDNEDAIKEFDNVYQNIICDTGWKWAMVFDSLKPVHYKPEKIDPDKNYMDMAFMDILEDDYDNSDNTRILVLSYFIGEYMKTLVQCMNGDKYGHEIVDLIHMNVAYMNDIIRNTIEYRLISY